MPYVVEATEHLRDGRESHAKLFATLEQAEAWIAECMSRGRVSDTYSFRLFALGKEISLEPHTEETPQPPVERTTYRVKGKR